MEIVVRNYNPSTDYEQIRSLYQDSTTFGGQYDEARDSEEKLSQLSKSNPNKILVAEFTNMIVGTVTLFEDGRAARLYRFAVQHDHETTITQALYDTGITILRKLGHTQVLVYAPSGNPDLEHRYIDLGLHKGNTYTAFRADI